MDMLTIERIWEDADFYEIEVNARNSVIHASVKSYTTEALINELATRLLSFPQSLNDRYFWENGERGDESTPYLSLEFWSGDKLGHVVVEVYMEIDDGAPYSKHNCCFFIKTDIGQLNNFGKSLLYLNQCTGNRKISLNESMTRST